MDHPTYRPMGPNAGAFEIGNKTLYIRNNPWRECPEARWAYTNEVFRLPTPGQSNFQEALLHSTGQILANSPWFKK